MRYLTGLILCFNLFMSYVRADEPLVEHIHLKILETIENVDNVPGLKAEEFAALKPGMIGCWNELVQKGVLEVTATDRQVRPYFVGLQAIIEHVLAEELNKNVQSLVGVILTPMPATPLCTEGSISAELVDSTIATDPLRVFTVKARTTIIRDYLFQGGNLYIVYPKEGLVKRTVAQQEIYKRELEYYPDHLFDRPLDCESIPNELVGAFYLFEDSRGKTFGFAIQMTQANNPQDKGSFGLWFGELQTSPIKDRIFLIVENVLKYTSDPILSEDSLSILR